MSRLRTLLMAGLLLTPGVVLTARATTFAALTLAQQAKKADVIVQATILAPTTVTEGANTYAVYPLKVSETLAGDAALLPQTVGSQGGGGPALFVLSGVDSAPVFQAGQEAVLLLYKGRLDSPLVGYNQGAYLISGGQVSVLFPPLAAGASGAGQNGVASYGSAQSPVAPSSAAQPGTSASPTSPAATPTPAASTTTTAPATTGTAAPGAATNTGGGATTPPVTPPVTAPTTSQTPTNQAPATQPPATQTPAATSPAPPSATTPSAEAPAATGTPASPSGSPTQPASSAAPAASSPSAQNAPTSPAPSSATVSVLGSIRTPAELKAAIVAARAAK